MSAMRYEQALHVMEVAGARGAGNLVLGGGEPFTWQPGVSRLAAEAKRRGFFVQVGTNGVAAPEGFEHAPEFDRYVLPLDGARAETHNHVRLYGGGHYEVIRERMARLSASGKPMTISTVVTAHNLRELPEIAALLADEVISGARLHAWHLYRFIPSGRGGAKHAESLWISEGEYEDACAEVKGLELGFTIFKRKDMRHSKTVDFYWYENDVLKIGSEVWGKCSREAAVVSAFSFQRPAFSDQEVKQGGFGDGLYGRVWTGMDFVKTHG